MKIECKLQREGGTEVVIGTTAYHFTPLKDGAHVADVANEAHQDRFLSIPEAYRMYRGDLAAPAGAPVAIPEGNTEPVIPEGDDSQAEPAELQASAKHPESFDINGKSYGLNDVVQLAFAASGVSADEWNEFSDDTRADLIDDELDKLAADTNGDGTVDDKEERAALAIQFKAKHGKMPHYNLSMDKLRAAVAE